MLARMEKGIHDVSNLLKAASEMGWLDPKAGATPEEDVLMSDEHSTAGNYLNASMSQQTHDAIMSVLDDTRPLMETVEQQVLAAGLPMAPTPKAVKARRASIVELLKHQGAPPQVDCDFTPPQGPPGESPYLEAYIMGGTKVGKALVTVDTGSVVTTITSAMAKQLGLKLDPLEEPNIFQMANGSSNQVTHVTSFTMRIVDRLDIKLANVCV